VNKNEQCENAEWMRFPRHVKIAVQQPGNSVSQTATRAKRKSQPLKHTKLKMIVGRGVNQCQVQQRSEPATELEVLRCDRFNFYQHVGLV
jgi:hypothetical protein